MLPNFAHNWNYVTRGSRQTLSDTLTFFASIEKSTNLDELSTAIKARGQPDGHFVIYSSSSNTNPNRNNNTNPIINNNNNNCVAPTIRRERVDFLDVVLSKSEQLLVPMLQQLRNLCESVNSNGDDDDEKELDDGLGDCQEYCETSSSKLSKLPMKKWYFDIFVPYLNMLEHEIFEHTVPMIFRNVNASITDYPLDQVASIVSSSQGTNMVSDYLRPLNPNLTVNNVACRLVDFIFHILLPIVGSAQKTFAGRANNDGSGSNNSAMFWFSSTLNDNNNNNNNNNNNASSHVREGERLVCLASTRTVLSFLIRSVGKDFVSSNYPKRLGSSTSFPSATAPQMESISSATADRAANATACATIFWQESTLFELHQLRLEWGEGDDSIGLLDELIMGIFREIKSARVCEEQKQLREASTKKSASSISCTSTRWTSKTAKMKNFDDNDDDDDKQKTPTANDSNKNTDNKSSTSLQQHPYFEMFSRDEQVRQRFAPHSWLFVVIAVDQRCQSIVKDLIEYGGADMNGRCEIGPNGQNCDVIMREANHVPASSPSSSSSQLGSNASGITPYMVAVKNGCLEILHLLHHCHNMHMGKQSESQSVTPTMKERRSTLNFRLKDICGNTCLHYAVQGNNQALGRVLEHMKDQPHRHLLDFLICEKNCNGFTPLHELCIKYFLEVDARNVLFNDYYERITTYLDRTCGAYSDSESAVVVVDSLAIRIASSSRKTSEILRLFMTRDEKSKGLAKSVSFEEHVRYAALNVRSVEVLRFFLLDEEFRTYCRSSGDGCLANEEVLLQLMNDIHESTNQEKEKWNGVKEQLGAIVREAIIELSTRK